MDTPLSLDVPSLPSITDSMRSDDSDYSSASAASDESLHLSWVRLPPGVTRTIRLALGGPFSGAPSAAKARLWASLGPMALGCSGGYLVRASFDSVSDSWAVLGWPGGIAMALTGLTVAECTCHMAFAVHGMWRPSDVPAQADAQPSGGGAQPINNYVDGDSVSFLEMLLSSRLNPSVVAAVEYRKKLTVVQVLGYVVVVLSMIVGMGVGLSEVRGSAGLTLDEELFVVLGIIACPISGIICSGWLLFIHVPCLVAEETIRQQTARIRSKNARTADYDAIMGSIQNVHETTVRLGALLSPPLLGIMFCCLMIGGFWMMMALAPPPTDPDSWALTFLPPWLLVLGVAMMYVGALYPLFAAATVTGACEEMASAINELRGAKGPDGRVVLTSPDNLTRIDGLRRYLRELNRHQGLGFSLRRKRITSTFMCALRHTHSLAPLLPAAASTGLLIVSVFLSKRTTNCQLSRADPVLSLKAWRRWRSASLSC
jgi:hypothetical protein